MIIKLVALGVIEKLGYLDAIVFAEKKDNQNCDSFDCVLGENKWIKCNE